MSSVVIVWGVWRRNLLCFLVVSALYLFCRITILTSGENLWLSILLLICVSLSMRVAAKPLVFFLRYDQLRKMSSKIQWLVACFTAIDLVFLVFSLFSIFIYGLCLNKFTGVFYPSYNHLFPFLCRFVYARLLNFICKFAGCLALWNMQSQAWPWVWYVSPGVKLLINYHDYHSWNLVYAFMVFCLLSLVFYNIASIWPFFWFQKRQLRFCQGYAKSNMLVVLWRNFFMLICLMRLRAHQVKLCSIMLKQFKRVCLSSCA